MRLGRRVTRNRSRTKNGNKSSTGNDSHASRPHLSADLISTIFLPKIQLLATKSIELYAHELFLYEKKLHQLTKEQSKSSSEIQNDGTLISSREDLVPPRKPLFHSEYQLHDFKATVLTDVSDHFFAEKGGWRIQANAAKFERLLDQKYGFFRPFITSHPEIDQFIRSLQRKYASGYFSPFRQIPLPISRVNTIVLLFMMHRGKVSWQITVLTALLFLVGLQPWALVCVVGFVQLLIIKRRNRVVGQMSRSIPTTQSYFRVGLDTNADKNVDLAKRKKVMLRRPVGTNIKEFGAVDIVNTSKVDVILLGSGVPTLYAAALLARAGRKVLVLSQKDDASGCLTLESYKNGSDLAEMMSVPFDVDCCNISKVSRQQRLVAPALCTETDIQGGIRFAQIGCEADGYAFELLSVPGMGAEKLDQQIIFAVCGSGGLNTLMDQAANALGDGWPGADGEVSQSLTGAYVKACESMNATSSAYYLSKILPESVNKFRRSSAYQECAVRQVSSLLNKVFLLNAHTRSLMAAIGMKTENIRPSSTSMAAHVTNVCATLSGEGMHYPIGGPRALSLALSTVVEQNGGRIVTGANFCELLFDESIDTSKWSGASNSSDKTISNAPFCVGVKLCDGTQIRFEKSRYTSGVGTWPVVVSNEGFIHTFIRMLPDDIRTKYKVPRGLPAISERRPLLYILFALRGNASELELTGADYFRLPGAALACDEIDPQTGEVKTGETGWPDYDDEGGADEALVQSIDEKDEVASVKITDKNNQVDARKKRKHLKFHPGNSWMHVAFPSAKDPSFESRHGKISTCVVSIEADDDFVVPFDTKPKIFVIKKPTASTPGDLTRVFERVKKDLVSLYPQLEGNIIHSEVRGPFNKGARQNPERYAAKGIRPETPYPGLFIGGSDLTVDTFSGCMVAGWLLANSVVGYDAVDHLFLQKNITTDIQHFLAAPGIVNEEDLAVPWDNAMPNNDLQKVL